MNSATEGRAHARHVWHKHTARRCSEPLGYVDGMNLYQYVRSNPADLTDPQGLCSGTAPDANETDWEAWNNYGEDAALYDASWDAWSNFGADVGVYDSGWAEWNNLGEETGGAWLLEQSPGYGMADVSAGVAGAVGQQGEIGPVSPEADNVASSREVSVLDHILEGLAAVANFVWGITFGCAGCTPGCEQTVDTLRATTLTDKEKVNLGDDQRYRDAMTALQALSRNGTLPNKQAPQEISKLVSQGTFKGSDKIHGIAATMPDGTTVISTDKQFNAGDMALMLVGEWQRQQAPKATHAYNKFGDEEKMNKEIGAVRNGQIKYAEGVGKEGAKWKPGEWAH